MSDGEVLELLRSQRTAGEGIRFLYQQHFESLSSFIIHNNGASEDAQDVFQEVIVSFIQLVKQEKFRGEASIKTFLFSMNRNVWFNELKRRKRANDREKKYDKMQPAEEEEINRVIENREASGKLIQVLDNLGEACKKILLLYYYENLSMTEILSQTDYENEQTVRNKKYKCMKKLEEMVSADKNLYLQLKNLLHE
ncbi:MAG: RNA polymerase sigma factor [Flavisolibacter sp.]